MWRWHANLANGSILKALGYFSTAIGMSRSEFATLRVEKMGALAQDFVNDSVKSINPKTGKPHSPGIIDNELGVTMSRSKWNRKKFERKIKVANINATPTLDDELAPSQQDLHRLSYADTMNLRTRVSIALIAFSGCRLEV